MLRLLALLLIVANLLFWAFSRGTFDGVLGLHAEGDREPDRLARQVRPQSVRIVAAASQAAAGGACLELGPVAPADAAAVQAALSAALPAGAWSEQRGEAASGSAATLAYRVAGVDAATAARVSALALGPGGRYAFAECTRPGR